VPRRIPLGNSWPSAPILRITPPLTIDPGRRSKLRNGTKSAPIARQWGLAYSRLTPLPSGKAGHVRRYGTSGP
jgi:hypothetical protein